MLFLMYNEWYRRRTLLKLTINTHINRLHKYSQSTVSKLKIIIPKSGKGDISEHSKT